jgi:putative DNA primase/helicase
MITPIGGPLTPDDLAALAARWIDPATAAQQFLRRVTSIDGAAAMGRNGAPDYAGVLIPNIWPGTDHVREYRLRRDHPSIENGKVKAKYLSPPGRGNLLYFPVLTDPAWLNNPELPLVVVEGEFKAMALDRAARHDWDKPEPRFLVTGLSGVWNWRSTIGKTTDAEGNRVDVKGAIADLSRLTWDERSVLILFDSDIEDNESVRAARFLLTKELRSRGARVSWFQWPQPPQAKGIDDLLAAIGPEPVLRLIEAAWERAAGPPDLIPCHFTDSGNGDRLVLLHGADLRYCFAFKRWMRWDGARWAVDETGRALRLTKHTMIEFLRQAVEAKNEAGEGFARGSLNAKRLLPALLLAQPELPITPTELDTDSSLLNFTNGTLHLPSGRLYPHRRSDLITKLVHHAYKPEAQCPRWIKFLDEIMGVNADAAENQTERADELVNFLQVALGYSITGEVNEKVLFVAYGSGDNGKTTLLSVIRDLIREYAVTIGLELLTAKDDSNNVAAARANLLGVRFAVSSETEEGQRLSASRLKRICQGDGGVIEACRKYENPICFRESHKLWVDGNHKPELPPNDVAVWNRLRLIPFEVTIPPENQDHDLKAALLREAEGILAWLVVGAKRWYAEGLPESDIVNEATGAWQKELDRLAEYLGEHTERSTDTEAYLRNKVLYEAYKSWAEENGERSLSQVRFSRQLESMNYRKGGRTEGGNIWVGIRFKKPL